jgi:hypothetical protein
MLCFALMLRVWWCEAYSMNKNGEVECAHTLSGIYLGQYVSKDGALWFSAVDENGMILQFLRKGLIKSKWVEVKP